MKQWIRQAAWLLLCALAALGVPLGQAGVVTTKHNLSVSGPGTVKSTIETETCIFCHAPRA